MVIFITMTNLFHFTASMVSVLSFIAVVIGGTVCLALNFINVTGESIEGAVRVFPM